MTKLLTAPLILFFTSIVLSVTASAQSISAMKAAELACHRIERLVLQKKIDKTYLSKFQKLTVVPLQGDPTGASFAVTAYQTAPVAEGAIPLSLTILIDSTGMVLKYAINEGGSAGADIIWSGKDPISLTEAGLHYVIDNQNTIEELKPFAENFQSLIIEQKTGEGKTTGELKMSNTINSSKLILTLDPSGKLLNKEVVPQ